MRSIETVSIDDVYPYESGGVRMNPRDFDAQAAKDYVAALAAQFANNRLAPGQPRVPPILYRDGGTYLIVDGECRWRAMLLAGTKRFEAEVYDDLDDAEQARREAAKAMLETDAKLRLSELEVSRGVQTLLDLDVPDEETAASARVDVAKVSRARRAARAAADAAYDMTIDRLLAIDELSDDPAAVAELSSCPEADWRRVADRLRSEREAARRREAAEAAVAASGLQLVDGELDGLEVARSFGPGIPDLAERLAEQARAGAACARVTPWCVTAYRPAAPQAVDDGATDELLAASKGADESRQRRRAWVAQRAADPSSMPATASLLAGVAHRMWYVSEVEELGGCVPPEATPLAVALGMSAMPSVSAYEARERSSRKARAFAELLAAMAADGYEPDAFEARVAREIEGGEWDGE